MKHWQKLLAVAQPAVITPDEGIRLYVQSGPDWDPVEIRGWWKNRLFITIPECMCDGGELAELNRDDLKSKRYATHNGYDYLTPDGRRREDEANNATRAAGQIKERRYVQYHDHFVDSKTKGQWIKVRIYNFNQRWVFIDWNADNENAGNPSLISWLSRRDLSTARGAMAYPNCITFHDSVGVKAKAESDRQEEERRVWREKNEGKHTFIHNEDAGILGLSINANTEAKVLAAFRKLSKRHHPDMGGSAQEFRRLCAAKDRALADLKAGGCKNSMAPRGL